MKINLKRCMATTETILNHKELDLIFKKYVIFEYKDSVIGVTMDKKDFDKYFIILEENT